jgi:hypothetical protein
MERRLGNVEGRLGDRGQQVVAVPHQPSGMYEYVMQWSKMGLREQLICEICQASVSLPAMNRIYRLIIERDYAEVTAPEEISAIAKRWEYVSDRNRSDWQYANPGNEAGGDRVVQNDKTIHAIVRGKDHTGATQTKFLQIQRETGFVMGDAVTGVVSESAQSDDADIYRALWMLHSYAEGNTILELAMAVHDFSFATYNEEVLGEYANFIEADTGIVPCEKGTTAIAQTSQAAWYAGFGGHTSRPGAYVHYYRDTPRRPIWRYQLAWIDTLVQNYE